MGTESHESEEGKIRLVGLSGGYKGNEYFLAKDVYIIGRAGDCDLALNESTISAQHAKIERAGDHYQISDMGSTNGTFVNGVKVDKKALRTDDKIRFDVFEFQYVNPAEVARTIVAEAPDFAPPAETVVRQPAQAAAPPEQAAAPLPRPSGVVERDYPQPRARPAVYERKGSMFGGLILGLIIAFIFGYGGLFMGAWTAVNFATVNLVDGLLAVFATFPVMHLHTTWMYVQWGIANIVAIVCLPLALLLGGLIAQSIGRRNRFGTAILFSIFYVLIAAGAQIAALRFDIEIWKLIAGAPAANFGIYDPWLGLAVTFGYFFGVTFVLSFIGALLGRK